MRISGLHIAALLCLASLPALAQVNDTYIITGAANGSGASGTRWLTQFSLFNPHFDYTLGISVTFLPTGGAQGIEEIVDVPPNSLAYSDNILRDLFGVNNGSGSLLVATFAEDNPGVPNTVLARAFLVTTNTYNNARNGTFGQTVPGIWTGLIDDGISAVAHDIRNSTRSRWRTNIGAANLGRCNVTLRVSVYDADGHTVLNQAPFGLPPLGHWQDRLPVEIENGTVEFYVEDPCRTNNDLFAVVFPYTSTIDGLSGDPRYQSPALLAGAGILVPNAQSAQAAARVVDPTSLGKKIDSAYARGVRATAERRGTALLIRDERGWRITR